MFVHREKLSVISFFIDSRSYPYSLIIDLLCVRCVTLDYTLVILVGSSDAETTAFLVAFLWSPHKAYLGHLEPQVAGKGTGTNQHGYVWDGSVGITSALKMLLSDQQLPFLFFCG